MQGMILRSTTSTATVMPPDTIVSGWPPSVITYADISPQGVSTGAAEVTLQVPLQSTVVQPVITEYLLASTDTPVVAVAFPVMYDSPQSSTVATDYSTLPSTAAPIVAMQTPLQPAVATDTVNLTPVTATTAAPVVVRT